MESATRRDAGLQSAEETEVDRKMSKPKDQHDSAAVSQTVREEKWRDQQRTNWWRQLCVQWTMVGITGAATVAAIISLAFLKETLEANKISADAARKSVELADRSLSAVDRPWLSVRFEIGSDLKFSSEGGRITIVFAVKNIGKSPALHADVYAEFRMISPRSDFVEEHLKTCARTKPPLTPDTPAAGFSLFPDEQLVISHSLPISHDDMQKARLTFEDIYKDDGPLGPVWFNPILFGCVTYRFASDGSYHQTPFIADIFRIDHRPNSRMGIDPSKGDLPARMLRLEHSIMFTPRAN